MTPDEDHLSPEEIEHPDAPEFPEGPSPANEHDRFEPEASAEPAKAESVERSEDVEDIEDVEDESVEGEASEGRPEEQLQALIESAKTSRLSPGDEDRAVQLLKQTITGGPKALPATLDAILNLSWGAAVKAVTDAWPETKPAGRARLLNGLAKAESESSRRVRLSLARGLHAQDAAAALKLILSVCEAMGGAQGGSTTKDRQIFANVMLGKARPWLMNIAMADMKPADAHKLITPALESCHQAPIFTQIWVLRWIFDGGKFDVLPPEHVEAIGKSIHRWQPRWQKELRKIIPKLPDPLEAVLTSLHGPAPVAHVAHAAPPAEAPPAETAEEERDDEPDDELPTAEEELAAVIAGPDPVPHARHGRGSRERGSFDLNRSLREIESYVSRLRSELQQAQTAARRRDSGAERHRTRGQAAPGSAEEFEELRRFNSQLEEQNSELRQRIEELTSDHEDRAATLDITDSLEQFKTLLTLKLKEDFADYAAITRESLDEVVRRHALEILGRVFEVLRGEGVKFEKPE